MNVTQINGVPWITINGIRDRLLTITETEKARVVFEQLVGDRDSYHLKRSRKGTYVNPAIARDWRWFQLGYARLVP
jgi:hypothetical protein